MRARGTIGLALVLALVVVLPARASYDPLASGQAKLSLEKPFRALLSHNHLKLVGRKGARVVGQRSAILPVSGGEADPMIEKGSFELGGELILQGPRKKAPFTKLEVKTKRSPLYAKVGGGQQKVALARQIAFKREGFGYGFSATGLQLSQKSAVRLDKRLDTEAFVANQPLGDLEVSSQPATTAVLAAGRGTLVPDPAFLAKLKALHVSLTPISPAELAPGPVLSFPIAVGGMIAPDGALGTIRLGGAMELLQQGAGQVFWQEPWIDLGTRVASAEANIQPAPPYLGKEGRIGLFDLGPAALASEPRARTVSVSSAPLTLQAATAAALNEALGERKEVFRAGEALGALSFTVQGQ
jgi:hypothetical protein